ncbi:O-antigen ligase family protein [Candidatus Gracilibacteria bacterium]|nr:O-antigen ligase family protein [Candidatus Gracilibacteria bacterium]
MFFDHILLLAILVLGGVGLLAVTYMARYPKLSYVLLFLSIAAGQVARFSLNTDSRGGSAIIATDLITLLMVAVWLWRKLALKELFRAPQLTKPVLLFLVIVSISTLVGLNTLFSLDAFDLKSVVVSFSYLIRLAAYTMLYFITDDFLSTDPQNKNFLLNCIFITSIVVSIGGFIQLLLVPDFTAYAIQYGWDPHQDRLLGTFFDPNFIGSYFAFIMALGMGLYPTATKRHKIIIGFSILFCAVALLLTFSRTGYVAFLAAFIIIGMLRSPKVLLIGSVCIMMGLIASPKALQRITDGLSVDETGLKRVASWNKGTRILSSYPLFGVGYNNLATVQDFYALVDEFDVNNRGGLENSVLTVAVTTGVFGVLAYIYLWAQSFILTNRVWLKKKLSQNIRNQSLAIMAALAAVVVSSIFMNSLFYPFLLVHIWIVSAMIPSTTHYNDQVTYGSSLSQSNSIRLRCAASALVWHHVSDELHYSVRVPASPTFTTAHQNAHPRSALYGWYFFTSRSPYWLHVVLQSELLYSEPGQDCCGMGRWHVLSWRLHWSDDRPDHLLGLS